jgi:uncharacterized DUF497 family protein
MSFAFGWDKAKRHANIAKHGIDFLDVLEIFAAPHLEIAARPTSGERRHLAVGPLDGPIIAVVFTHRGEAIRIISARRARHGERRQYQALYH